MKKFRNIQLFTVILVLVFVFYSPAFAKSENDDNSNVNDKQVNVSDSRDSINNNDQKDLNDNEGDQNIQEEDNNDQEGDNQSDDNQFDVEKYTNEITTSTQSLLDVANKEKGDVGEKIKKIVDEQNNNKDDIAKGLEKIQKRSKVKTFLLGTDYKNIGQVRSEIVKTSNQIDQLNEVLGQTTNADTKTIIQDQVKTLEQQQQKIGDVLVANESKFSLFGWFMKLFSK